MNCERCILCGSSLPETGMPLCRECRNRLEESKLGRVFSSFCSNCGFPLLSGGLCSTCSRRHVSSVLFRSCFLYRGLVRELIIAWKFYGTRNLSRYFADALMPLLEDVSDIPAVWIPGSIRNTKRRGWDQMREVAGKLAKNGIVAAELFVPANRAMEQKVLNRQQRSVNTGGRFILDTVRISHLAERSPIFNEKREIILLDDIRTTGATLRHAADLLQLQGIRTLRAITIAMD